MGIESEQKLLMVAARPSIETRLTNAFGLRHPFACAGLAFAGMTPPLCIAVAEAGGVGAFGVGKLPPEAVEGSIAAIRAATDGVININFITIFTTEDHIALCEKLRPPIVSFHWGHPDKHWIRRLQDAEISVWEQVGSVAAAKLAVDDGIDVIIAQGSEAGGHNYGSLPIFALLPAVIDAVSPKMVLAAGAIADGRGVAGALALGADGVWVGTRMAATREGDIAPGYKQRLVEASGEDTVLTSLFGRETLEFNPMRVLRNSIVDEYAGREDEAPNDPQSQDVIGTMPLGGMEMPLHRFSNLVPMSGASGDVDQMPLLAGQGVGLISDLPPAGEVIEAMMAEAAMRLRALGSRAS
jgi:NAD(P)H-dependent flavin oxidoreductase YrpB (nitropropane dioxygenase family)